MILMVWQDLHRNLRLWDMRIKDCFNGLKEGAYVNISLLVYFLPILEIKFNLLYICWQK